MAKLLLIDDSWLTRRGLSGMVSDMGHTVIEAENGKVGLEMVKNENPDCILLDLLMPEMDGYEVLTRLAASKNQIPVLVCTADIQNTARQKCLALGAAGFLNKPPKEEELKGLITKVLGE
ncbi:MAG TPA: response regulator [Desulfobacteraceae bacterium]|nr:response regulator [Desulfobacteraceae bacterium]